MDIIRVWRGLLAVLLLVPLLVACNAPSTNADELSLAEQRWESAGLVNYRYTLQIGCFCPPPLNDQLIVEVQNGATAQIRTVSSGEAVPFELVREAGTVPGLFTIIRQARQQNADKIEVSYDEALGYPTRISIDYIAQAIDDEVTYLISDLVEIPALNSNLPSEATEQTNLPTMWRPSW